MNIIKNERIVPFDIDNTLILPIDPDETVFGRRVQVYDPLTKKFITMQSHEPNIRLLKEENHRGAHILVWSRGGYQWAANVVKALDLVPYVDTIMTKPIVYVDDTPVKKWMKDRVYLEPNMLYKR